jgi:uncharacterized protein
MSETIRTLMPARDPCIDALRALALLGVLVVNLSSYASTPMYASSFDVPSGTGLLDRVLHVLVAGLLTAKAYPVLTFLFGYSLVLAAQRDAATGQASRGPSRMRRLALIGLLHGALLYFGDILLPYAVAGWLTLRVMNRRLARLKRHCAAWLAAAVVLWLVMTVPVMGFGDIFVPQEITPTLGNVDGWRAFAGLNGELWLTGIFGQLFLLPQFMVLMLLGALAGRLRLLQHRRWQAALARCALRVLPWAVLANFAVAVVAVWPGLEASTAVQLSILSSSIVGPVMGLALMAWWRASRFARPSPGIHRLAALGQRTLSLYLAHSLVAVLVLSGAGWGWQLGLGGTLTLALSLWGMAWWLAQIAARRGWRGPAESWLARA